MPQLHAKRALGFNETRLNIPSNLSVKVSSQALGACYRDLGKVGNSFRLDDENMHSNIRGEPICSRLGCKQNYYEIQAIIKNQVSKAANASSRTDFIPPSQLS